MLAFIQHSGNANFRYAVGIDAESSFHIFSIDGETREADGRLNAVIVPDLEGSRAKEAFRGEVLTYSRIGYHEKRKKGVKNPLVESLLEFLKERGVEEVAIPEDFPAKLAFLLRDRIPVRIEKNPFEIRRAVKTEREVELIRQTCIACVDSVRFLMKFVSKYISRGKKVRCEELRRLVELRLFSRGFIAENTIIASGVKTYQPHWIGYGFVEGHVVADIFPKDRESGYFGDFTRTIIVGEVDEEIVNMLKACIEAKNRAEKLVKPGILAKDVHYAVCDVLESYGYSTLRNRKEEGEGFIHSTGHGVGLEVHEEPRIFENEDVIREGMVFTVEPGLYYRDVGGVRVEDTLVVRRSGAEILTPCEDYLKVEFD